MVSCLFPLMLYQIFYKVIWNCERYKLQPGLVLRVRKVKCDIYMDSPVCPHLSKPTNSSVKLPDDGGNYCSDDSAVRTKNIDTSRGAFTIYLWHHNMIWQIKWSKLKYWRNTKYILMLTTLLYFVSQEGIQESLIIPKYITTWDLFRLSRTCYIFVPGDVR